MLRTDLVAPRSLTLSKKAIEPFEGRKGLESDLADFPVVRWLAKPRSLGYEGMTFSTCLAHTPIPPTDRCVLSASLLR